MRRCVGCMESKEKKDLIRIACYRGKPDGRFDRQGKRTEELYLCRDNSSCLEKAYKKKALERSLGMPISENKAEIFSKLNDLTDKSQNE